MKSRMRASSRHTACVLRSGANSVLRTRHYVQDEPIAYTNRRLSLSRQRLNTSRQQPHLPLVVVGTSFDALAKRVEASVDHPWVGFAVGPKQPFPRASPQSDVREAAQLRLGGDVVHLPVEVLGEIDEGPVEIIGQLDVVRSQPQIAASAEESVVLLENREGKEPERSMLGLLRESFLQHIQPIFVILCFKNKADVVKIDRLCD